MIDYLSKELLEAAIELKLKYKEIKAKLIKNTVNNALPGYKKWVIKKKETEPQYMKKNQLLLKMWEKNKKKQNIYGVALENKIGQQKSMHTDCDSEKSTFLKPLKKQK